MGKPRNVRNIAAVVTASNSSYVFAVQDSRERAVAWEKPLQHFWPLILRPLKNNPSLPPFLRRRAAVVFARNLPWRKVAEGRRTGKKLP